MKGHYFKTKLKIAQIENNLNTGCPTNKLKIFFYKIYLKLLEQIILLFNGPKESFQILKEDLQKKHGKVIKIVVKNGDEKETISIDEIGDKIKKGYIDEDILEELLQKLFQLHEQKQKKTVKLSLAGLAIIIITTIISSLVTSFLFPAIFKSRASDESLNQTTLEEEIINIAVEPEADESMMALSPNPLKKFFDKKLRTVN